MVDAFLDAGFNYFDTPLLNECPQIEVVQIQLNYVDF